MHPQLELALQRLDCAREKAKAREDDLLVELIDIVAELIVPPAEEQPTLREVPPPAPLVYHAKDGAVHHTSADCSTGNNIEPENFAEGDGGLQLCSECERLAAEAKE